MVRSLLEWMSRGVVFKRRMPVEFGRRELFVSPDASLKYWRTNLWKVDPVLLNAARLLVSRNDVVWDIGANVGLFSIAASELAGAHGRVFAVEPDPWLSELLRKSAGLNVARGAPIKVLSVAVMQAPGIAELKIARRGRAANFIEGREPSTQTGGVRATVTVPTASLDWLLDWWPAPDVLKIDVEGAEASVLQGAVRLLEGARPKILCEVSAANCEAVTAALKSARYLLHDAAAFQPGAKPLDRCAWNTLAIPADSDGLDATQGLKTLLGHDRHRLTTIERDG